MTDPVDQPGEFPKSPDRLKSYAGLLSDVSLLVTELEAYKQAGESFESFVSPAKLMPEAVIPQLIRESLPGLELITVDIRKEEDENISISVDLVGQGATLIVSGNSGMGPDQRLAVSDLNRAGDDAADAVGDISLGEFNTLIVSLLYPDAERGYEMFERVDLFTPEVAARLSQDFSESMAARQATLSNILEANGVLFEYSLSEDEPSTFYITYPEETHGRMIRLEGNLETSLNLSFTTIDDKQEKLIGTTKEGEVVDLGSIAVQGRTPYFPSNDEIKYLRSILGTELYNINPPEYFVSEEDVAGDKSAEEVVLGKGLSLFSPDYTQRILKQLGFDAPDSSTT